MTPLSEIPLEGRLMRPAKHGWSLDYSTPEGRRVHVRVFAFETGYMEGVACELPSALSQAEAVEMLRGAAERMAPVDVQIHVDSRPFTESMSACLQVLGLGGTGKEEESDAAQRVPTSDDGVLATKLPAIRRVLFLDVDGVLNTRPGSLKMDKILLVSQLIDAVGASVVISSSWRMVPEQMVRLKQALASGGIEPIGQTPCLDEERGGLIFAKPRWREIEAWLQANPGVDQFVILDDLPKMGDFGPQFVHVYSHLGFTPERLWCALFKFRDQAEKVGDVLPPEPEWLPKARKGGAEL